MIARYSKANSYTIELCDAHAPIIMGAAIQSASMTYDKSATCDYCNFAGGGAVPEHVTRRFYGVWDALKLLHSRYGRGDIKQIVWGKPGYCGIGGIVVCTLQYGMVAYHVQIMWDNKLTVDYRGHKRTVKP